MTERGVSVGDTIVDIMTDKQDGNQRRFAR